MWELPKLKFSNILSFILSLLIVITFDTLLTLVYVSFVNPSPSGSMGLIVIFPLYTFLNIALMLIFYYTTKKQKFIPIFLLNIFISCYILFVIFHAQMK